MQVRVALLLRPNISLKSWQWDSSDHAGFTTGKPWMRVNDDYVHSWNVAEETDDEESVLNFWKQAIATRKQYDVLVGVPKLNQFLSNGV